MVHSPHQLEHRSAISAVLTDENTAMNIGNDTETVSVLDLDQGLGPYKDHFGYRMKRYIEQKKLIEKYEGSLEDFAQGNDGKPSRHVHFLFLAFLFDSYMRRFENFPTTQAHPFEMLKFLF